MIIWYRVTIFLQYCNVLLYCLANTGDGFFFRLSLADASKQAWAFRNPITIFTWIENDLSHLKYLFVKSSCVKFTTDNHAGYPADQYPDPKPEPVRLTSFGFYFSGEGVNKLHKGYL